MQVLITNDDGVDSPGIHALTRAARKLDLDVTVAAPGWDSSGASASLTAVRHNGRIVLDRRRIPGLDATVFAIEAAPAFIAHLGASGGLGPKPDLLLSGINRGANTGQVILHSGTVGAVLTARTLGLPGVAFSLDHEGDGSDGDGEPHWSTAEAIAADVIAWMIAEPRSGALNVNIPTDRWRKFRHCGGPAWRASVRSRPTSPRPARVT